MNVLFLDKDSFPSHWSTVHISGRCFESDYYGSGKGPILSHSHYEWCHRGKNIPVFVSSL